MRTNRCTLAPFVLVLLACAAVVAICPAEETTATNSTRPSAAPPPLIPQPAKYESTPGEFKLTSNTTLVVEDATRRVADYFAELLAPALGEKLKIVDRTDAPPGSDASTINFSLSPGLNRLGPEGYTLVVAPQRIDIKAASPAGVFYACQTLRQMLPASIESPLEGGTPEVHDGRGNDSNVNSPKPFGGTQGVPPNPLTIPACTIEDQPRYPWRGMHLDVSRHFFPKETVESYLDLLAAYKMNVFHWHLTDDQGWRIEIKKYPLLTSVGAWRSYNAATDGPKVPAATADGTPGQYGGFYTQDDIREIVAYAKAHYINVVPEIEMPGHSNAALAAYPEFSCTGGPIKSGQVWGVYKDVYCAGKDSTFDFLENVLAEVCDLFPGPYIHVGGDECPKDRWKQCPDCQQRIKTEGLKNEEELQSYFIKRIEKFLETKHHQLIGWDEILQGGLAPGAAVTSWRGMAGGRTAASLGHDVVMCPESNCYFDHTADAGSNPKGSGAFLFVSPVPLSKVYAFEPTPADLAPDQARHILGAQGNVWTERIPTQDRLDYMAFPRTIALAECLWTPHRGAYDDFAARLLENLKRLDVLGVHYYDDPMARAITIGTWQPSDEITTTPKDIDFPLTLYVAAPGTYTVRFEYLEGKGQLQIESVALLENDKEIARDTHPAVAGSRAQANAFELKLDEVKPGAAYTVRAAVHAKEGDKTKGQVFLLAGATKPTRRDANLKGKLGGKRGRGSFFHEAFSGFLRGRPRGRSVDSNPSRLAIVSCHAGFPNGLLRRIAPRSVANSASFWARLTSSVQPRGRGSGQRANNDRAWASPNSWRHKLDHRQAWAFVTSPARNALRSTYRATV